MALKLSVVMNHVLKCSINPTSNPNSSRVLLTCDNIFSSKEFWWWNIMVILGYKFLSVPAFPRKTEPFENWVRFLPKGTERNDYSSCQKSNPCHSVAFYILISIWMCSEHEYQVKEGWLALCLFLVCSVCVVPVTVSALRHESSSNDQALESWFRIPLEPWIFFHVYSLCVVLCVYSGLATSWSPAQGVLPTVYRLRNWKVAKVHKGCRTIDR
jgi:hypothetical protein